MEGKIGRVILLIAIFWGCSVPLWAQGDGGQAGAFLRYGVGGRALGMGRAFVAVADDASGVYWNPACIVGTKRYEMTSMYSNLYYDSQFAHFGIVLPRLGKNIKDKVARYLIGPSSALGFGWIGLSTTGYEQRTDTGIFLGDFGISENAFLVAWAREEVGSWGIFQYGFSFKFVNQSFSGLSSSPSREFGGRNQDWSGGMDVGFAFRPIHAPIFRVFSLRYLLPLRLGLIVQNVIQPGLSATGHHSDIFPRVVRWGLSYRWILKDWIPTNWESFRRFLGNSQVLTTFDREHYSGSMCGTYFGIEGFLPLSRKGFALFPRAGFNNRSEGTSLGMGLSLPFTSSAVVRIDYAFGFHPYLPEDSRFFLTFQMGKEMGAEYFKTVSERDGIGQRDVRKYLLRVLSEYPNDYIVEAVDALAEREDSTRVRRYYDLTGGLGRAVLLFQDAKALLRQGKVDNARKRAIESTKEYAPIFLQPEHLLSDDQLLDFGEAYIIADRMEEAISILEEVEEPSLRTYYLLGVCKRAAGDWDGAIETFRSAVRRYEEEQDRKSMVCLSFLGLGEALLRKQQYQSALTTLEVLLKNYSDRLDPDYPRYPIYEDDYVVDDAQFLGGICTLLMRRSYEGVASILETQKFYPELECGQFVEEKTEELIEVLSTADWDRLDTLARQFLEWHYQNH